MKDIIFGILITVVFALAWMVKKLYDNIGEIADNMHYHKEKESAIGFIDEWES